ALLGTGCSRSAAPVEQRLYTCGMHPQVIQPKPGNCPICGMKLTPVRKPPKGAGSQTNAWAPVGNASEGAVISIDRITSQNMDLRTGVVTRGPLRRLIRTVGVIDL